MTLSKLITPELRRIGADQAALAGLPVDDAGLRGLAFGGVAGAPAARLDLFDADRYSVSLGRLSVAAGPLSPAEPANTDARMAALARGVIAQLAYLEEPLAVVERHGDATQIRSAPPQREEGELSYWEVALSGGERPAASIARYRWAPGMAERELLPYPAAFPLVARLADSLAAALAASE